MPRPKTETGQTYGRRKEQVESQQAIPIPKRPSVMPGGAGAFGRRTERPREPLTAGSPTGPGPGLEGLIAPTAPTDGREREYSKSLAEFLPMLEVRAAEPDASGTFRLFVRKVRQMVALASPPNQTA
jgi:hypothetical protein